MTARAPHFLDVGQPLIPEAIVRPPPLSTPIDITEAVTVEVIARRPSGVETVHAGEVYDGPRGLGVAHTAAEQLDETGRWTIQAHAIMPDGSEYHGPQTTLWVNANLNGDVGIPEGVSSHAPRHHHDGADPIDVEDLRSRYEDIRVLMAGVVDDFSEPAPNRVEGVPLFDIFMPVLSAQLQTRPLPLFTTIYNSTTITAAVGAHWSYRLGTRTGGASLISFRGTGGDSPLPAGWWAIYEQTGVGGRTEIQATEGMVLSPESDFLDAAGTKAVLETGERAIVYVRATDELVVVRHGGVHRLRAGTITGDETYQIAHHGQQRRYAIGTPATVTFVPARRGDTVVYDHMGAVADVLSFAFDGVTPVIQPGLTASISANGTVVARYLASGTVDLSGALDVAP
jgi:hypothetical protein